MVGDDPLGKSSAGPNYSEYDFFTMGMPVLFPGGPDEVLTLGLHGIAMSRFSGCWVGLKIVTNIADGGASVHVGPERPTIVRPELPGFERFYTFRLGPPLAVTSEQALFEWRLPAAVAYGRANNLDAIVQRGPQDRIGLVAAGKTFTDLRQSLEDMGIGPAELDRAAIRLLKLGMIFPLAPGLRAASPTALEQILVVEEKRALLRAVRPRALVPAGRAAPRSPASGTSRTGRPFPGRRRARRRRRLAPVLARAWPTGAAPPRCSRPMTSSRPRRTSPC